MCTYLQKRPPACHEAAVTALTQLPASSPIGGPLLVEDEQFPANTERLRDFDELVLPDGQALAYVYFEDEPGLRSVAKLLTRGGGTRWESARNSLRQDRKAK